jgi:hypothetical protein
MSNNNGHARVLFEVLMKEKVLEASLRRSVKQSGIERDNAYAAMKKSQLEHTLAVAKHENVQAELRQKIVTVGLIREAWDSERVAGVDVDPAGTVGGHAGINGGADSNSGTVTIDDVAVGANGAGVGAVASSSNDVAVGANGAGVGAVASSNENHVDTGADVGPDLDIFSEYAWQPSQLSNMIWCGASSSNDEYLPNGCDVVEIELWTSVWRITMK